MTTLYILKYNNYYNRIVKKEDALEGYMPYVAHTLINTNFNPNDGVRTTHIFGIKNNSYDGAGDYVVAVNEYEEIVSRWYVIEAVRTRGGQFNLTLYRDLIVDFYDKIITADVFIEKSTLALNDPLIFNSENMTYNQIKTKEREALIKDNTNCPWLVGYYSKGQEPLTGNVVQNNINNSGYISIDADIEEWDYFDYSNLGANNVFNGVITAGTYDTYAKTSAGIEYKFSLTTIGNNVSYEQVIGTRPEGETSLKFSGSYRQVQEQAQAYANARRAWENENGVNLNSYLSAYVGNSTKAEVDELLFFSGKTLLANGKAYAVKIAQNSVNKRVYVSLGNLFNAMSNIAGRANFKWLTASPQRAFYLDVTMNEYRIELTRLENEELTYSIGGTGKLITVDAPWNIFAIPYGEVSVTLENNTTITTDAETAIQTVMSIQQQHPGVVYDIQLLPYCPVQNLVTINAGQIQCESDAQYSLIKAGQQNAGIIFNVPKSNFTLDIPFEILQAQTNIERKINSECDKWRLTSPNYSNYFDFSVEKNGGITLFNVDCNYKPYTPYIHLNFDFKGLYGYDDNSPRGLVLGGDFSLSQIIDRWEEYQIQNKNYQLTFDRQIQNMEVKNNVARSQDVMQAITGSVIGGASGAVAGSQAGPVGAVAGAVVGAGMSAVGGVLDYQMNELLRNEALDYTKDLFGYQLGNIQALPNTISKISAFNDNNKIFPVLEYYTATEREKIALVNKVAFNGMTTMAIGKIQEYITNAWTIEIDGKTFTSKGYIKAKLIRIDDIDDDYHIINSIAGELNKGVFM